MIGSCDCVRSYSLAHVHADSAGAPRAQVFVKAVHDGINLRS